MVTKRRLELPRPHWPAGFKPAASTYSAILPYSIITLMFINHVAKILTFIGMCKSLRDFISYFNILTLTFNSEAWENMWVIFYHCIYLCEN